MLPEGMVHALELLHELIEPGGRLVDIRPSGEPPVITVRSASGDEIRVGTLQESDDFIEYRQADEAVAQAIARGWYTVEGQAVFPFVLHASSIAELAIYLENEYSDAILPADTCQRAQVLEQGAKEAMEVLMTERIRIARLRPEKI